MEKFYHWKVAWVLGNVRMASMPFARSLDRDRIFSRELFPEKKIRREMRLEGEE